MLAHIAAGLMKTSATSELEKTLAALRKVAPDHPLLR